MQRKNSTANPEFVLTHRSNQQLLDGAKHLTGRHRTVTAHLIAHLAEIYARKLHVAEGYSYLGDYCVGALGLSEDEGHRRAHAAVLAQKYPIILDLLLEGSIHLTSLRIIGKRLTPQNYKEVLEAACGKTKTELEDLTAAICPQADVPTVLRKLPEPKPELKREGDDVALFAGAVEAPALAVPTGESSAPATSAASLPSSTTSSVPATSRLAPLSPQRYNLQVTVDEDTYNALKQLQDLLRHQVRNGDLSRIIKDALLERLEQVKRQRFGHTKRPRKAKEQESWIGGENPGTAVSEVEKEPITPGRMEAQSDLIAPGRSRGQRLNDVKVMNQGPSALGHSRHIPVAVKREVWERDKGQCAFLGRTGKRCTATGRLEFHHVRAYALGGPATVENIALRCRAHNAYEGVALFGEKIVPRTGVNANQRTSNRPGAIDL
jgi:5-methylcytosine-specific restriction endonuclease McrA